MIKKYWLVLLVLITLLGGFLRFYKSSINPPSLTGDEISFGYAAYSILNTGRDESGKFLPLVIQSVGDYKNPLPAYLMVLSVKLFGLTDFAVRFQNAVFGTMGIPILFLFLKYIFKNLKLALLGSFFLAISSWHIYFSRFAYEPLIASVFALLGIWFLMKMFEGGKKWAFLSAFFLVLTMYTAFAPRLFVPIFVFCVLITKYKVLKKNKTNVFLFIITSLILGLPLVYVSLFQGAATRLEMVFINRDVDFVRYGIFNYFNSINDVPYLLFFWLKRYLNYLQPDFLFINGLNMTRPGSFGLGLLYIFELPWLVLGMWEFIRKKILHKDILVLYLLIGIVPDSLTNNLQHAGRLLHILPVVILITVLGAVCFFKLILGLRSRYVKLLLTASFSLFVIVVLIHAYLTFVVHFPRQKGESFDEGLREVMQYVVKNQANYQEIVFDIRHGVAAFDMVANPHMYLLFYSKYDPATYQREPKILTKSGDPYYKFNKYVFGYINWQTDMLKKDNLFIGSPWSFPDTIVKTGVILQKIYLTNGEVAYYIVKPK